MSLPTGWWRAALIAAFVCLPVAAAAAEDEDGGYELLRAHRAMAEQGLVLTPEPAGRRIEFIRIVRKDVLQADEPWPTWPNALHWQTTESRIREEH